MLHYFVRANRSDNFLDVKIEDFLMKLFNVAVDGPSGAGKSTISDVIAQKYHLIHLDTGAMYRAIALALHEQNVPASYNETFQQALDAIELSMDNGKVVVNGVDLTNKIREPHVSALASQYSALPQVRKKLVALQQQIASKQGYILDGRDICDVVLPDAKIKIYLDASVESRAKRRMLQDLEKGIQVPYSTVLKAIQDRDYADRTRKTDPLTISKQATVIDSSNLTFDETVAKIVDLIENTLKDE